jgi:hypothetical protein
MILLEAVGATGVGWTTLAAALVALEALWTPPTEAFAAPRRPAPRRRAFWRRVPTRSSRDLSRLADILEELVWLEEMSKAGVLRSQADNSRQARVVDGYDMRHEWTVLRGEEGVVIEVDREIVPRRRKGKLGGGQMGGVMRRGKGWKRRERERKRQRWVRPD